jgi:hypothetical protein
MVRQLAALPILCVVPNVASRCLLYAQLVRHADDK